MYTADVLFLCTLGITLKGLLCLHMIFLVPANLHSLSCLFIFQIEHKISLQQLAERLGVNFDVVCTLFFQMFSLHAFI